ncbi:hypothetical protein [Streptomyces adelaidensis]|uniref:hypothetical protein n=1 Tax=Streptomyces adelaidensis TaxID=2796465 RepID=UPI001F374A33|nr:hypothetical protein [Streptomyces adelaidensis]
MGAQISRQSRDEVTVPEHEEWELTNGFAWAFPGLNGGGMARPVIIADGFNLGPSELDKFYQGLEADFPFISTLRERGQAVVLLGFRDRTASILENAKAAREAVIRANVLRGPGGNLTVGGFSMGGLITRYALAKMESEGENHGTEMYFSYDSPHRGGFLPVAAQALTHHTVPSPFNFLRAMVDSPAAHEMLQYWYDPETEELITHPDREDFLNALGDVGWWPRRPRLIGVANGAGNGTGTVLPAGAPALDINGGAFADTTLFIQDEGDDVLVADIKRSVPAPPITTLVTTSGLTELDAAPGGTLDTYQIIATLMEPAGAAATVHFPDVCFVPSVSALDLRDPDSREHLFTPVKSINPDDSGLDEFAYADSTTPHTEIVPDLCVWLLERLQ